MSTLSQAQKAVKTYPAKITAKEFLAMIAENPSVFEHWETPLEIIGYVDCNRSPITHLSKHLTFSGKDKENWAANFSECTNLQIATGTFDGFVSFAFSNIKKIESLCVTPQNINEWGASFQNCKRLQIATGTYAGRITFENSGIHRIQNLQVTLTKNQLFQPCFFQNCPNLKTLENWDLSKEIKIEPDKLEKEKKRRASLKKYHRTTQPQELPFL
jgi:hypothetical protein